MARYSRFLLAWLAVILLIVAAACGAPTTDHDLAEPTATAKDEVVVTSTPEPKQVSTATKYELNTPTPQAAPPTPTSVPPTDTPVPPSPAPEVQGTQAAEQQSAASPTAEEPEPPSPSVTNEVIEIPGGPFTMGNDGGDPEDKPAHQVDVATFAIDRFEVTNADYDVFQAETGYVTYAEMHGFGTWRDAWEEGKDNHPVVVVTWHDAQAYCEWLGKRLPTEAEWEKSVRGTDGRRFPWGSEWDPQKANVKERGLRGTAAVGSFGAGASPFGVEDMIGNVWEWTADWYLPYPGNDSDDPYYGEAFRVTRGGGWFDAEAQSTTFSRNAADPNKTANDDLGFRCAR